MYEFHRCLFRVSPEQFESELQRRSCGAVQACSEPQTRTGEGEVFRKNGDWQLNWDYGTGERVRKWWSAAERVKQARGLSTHFLVGLERLAWVIQQKNCPAGLSLEPVPPAREPPLGVALDNLAYADAREGG